MSEPGGLGIALPRRGIAVGVSVLLTAMALAFAGAGPAAAATIPTPPAVCAPGSPVVTSLTESASTINVVTKSGRITFTVKASDPTQDVASLSLGVVSAFRKMPHHYTVPFTLTSGTARDGTWTGSLAIPRFSQSGTWGLTHISIEDAARGENYYSTNPDEGGAGWPFAFSRFQVVSKNDLTAPTVTSVKLSHSSANTTNQTQTLVATVTAKDNLSGVKSITVGGSVTIGKHAYATRGGRSRFPQPVRRAAPYQVSFLVPKGVGSGTHTWSLAVTVTDAAGISQKLSRALLLAKHFTSTFKVSSRTDVTPPRLTGLSFSTSSVNALSSDQKVTVTVRATDLVAAWRWLWSPSRVRPTTTAAHPPSPRAQPSPPAGPEPQ